MSSWVRQGHVGRIRFQVGFNREVGLIRGMLAGSGFQVGLNRGILAGSRFQFGLDRGMLAGSGPWEIAIMIGDHGRSRTQTA